MEYSANSRHVSRSSRERDFIAVIYALCALLCLAGAGRADARSNADDLAELTHGALVVSESGTESNARIEVPLVDTSVAMTINAMIARVTVKQTFQYDGQQPVNAVYAFPLPENAAVDHLRMQVGERRIDGVVKTRERARHAYEAARKQGRKASLLEQQRPNLFTTRVANLGPGERVVVEIEYQQTLDYRDSWFSIRFPMTIGIRYIPGARAVGGFDGGGWSYNTDEVADASSITPPVTAAGEGYHNPVTIDVLLNAGIPLASIESPYHAITSQKLSDTRYDISLAAGPVPADRDFELRFRPRPGFEPRAAFFNQQVDDSDYGMLMLLPPEVAWSRDTASARELVFVVDTSGSMHGTSIQQAREALKFGLSRLRSGDAFNIVQFNSTTEQLAPTALDVTPDNLRRATRYINRLRADGGTEMAAALRAVLDGGERHERLRQVVFITDGSVGNEASLFRIIDKQLGVARLFTVGIGSAPNTYFMREAAAVGRGTYTYVGAVDEVGERMSRLFEKLEFPVLTDITVSTDSNTEFAPDPLPDLHLHEPLLLNMKLHGATTMTVAGRFNGKPWQTEVPLSKGGGAAGIDVAWARQKIADLERSIARGVDRAEVNQAIEVLGLKHHLVTSQTSLVAVDTTPSKLSDSHATDANVPNKMPAGWSMATGTSSLPQTATPMALNLVIGTVTLLIAMMTRIRRCRS